MANARRAIAYLGPRASYTHQAATLASQHTEGVELISYSKIRQVVDAVRAGKVEAGVVPFYNSTHGVVIETLGSFAADLEQSNAVNGDANHTADSVKGRINIREEIRVPIKHCLVGFHESSSLELPDVKLHLTKIKRVYSHEQALGQCAEFLGRYLPNAKLIPVPSTSRAAEMLTEEDGSASGVYESVAVCSQMAAEEYNVPILWHSIQDRNDNTTRFFVIEAATTDEEVQSPTNAETNAAKSLIVFTVPHEQPGALVQVLNILIQHKLNMVGIHWRPPDETRTEDAIFVEAEGMLDDGMLKDLKGVNGSVRRLGIWSRL